MRKTFSLGVDVNSSYISLVFSKNPRNLSEPIIFKLIEKGQADFDVLDSGTIDRIEEVIRGVEQDTGISVSRVNLSLAQDNTKKVAGEAKKVLHPKRPAALAQKHIIASIEQARLLNLDWSSKCLHNFPLEFKLDGKLFTNPPLGVYGRRLEVKTVFYACRENYIIQT